MKLIWIVGAVCNFIIAILILFADYQTTLLSNFIAYLGCSIWLFSTFLKE